MEGLNDIFTGDQGELTTAAEQSRLPADIRSKIAKRNSAKGGDYERTIAKKLSAYHDLEWKTAFLRTKRTTGGQPLGDLKAIDEMADIWKAAKLGPIECKNQKVWTVDQIFKSPEKNVIIEYWKKSNADTSSDNSLVFFTKAGVSDYVLHLDDAIERNTPVLRFESQGQKFIIETLKSFLQTTWAR